MKGKLVKGEIYHIYNRSIANFGIFRRKKNKIRFINTLSYYNNTQITDSLSGFLRKNEKNYFFCNLLDQKISSYIKFISYCVMPDHYHLLIKILVNDCFSKYINDVENSYTRYFNIKYDRKGPLWQSDFKLIKIKTNNQLLHLTRYIHLNPVTKRLVGKPEEWEYSSYRDLINNEKYLQQIHEISISSPLVYKKFNNDRIAYQRKLQIIKNRIFD